MKRKKKPLNQAAFIRERLKVITLNTISINAIKQHNTPFSDTRTGEAKRVTFNNKMIPVARLRMLIANFFSETLIII